MELLLHAMIQFAILGTLGEIAGTLIKKEKLRPLKFLWSAVVWAVLGVFIKYAFFGFDGFVSALISKSYLPDNTILKAFFISFFMNVMFGPWLIILHRFFDNIIYKKFTVPTNGIKGAMLTLLWFWVPAHTITFLLPADIRTLVAAMWSFVLGLLLGFFAAKSKGDGVNE